MLGRIFVTAAPFVITAVRIMASDPAMRNFILGAFAGRHPRTARAPHVRPHADASRFAECPSCRGTGLVPVAPQYYRDDRDDRYRDAYEAPPAPRPPAH